MIYQVQNVQSQHRHPGLAVLLLLVSLIAASPGYGEKPVASVDKLISKG